MIKKMITLGLVSCLLSSMAGAADNKGPVDWHKSKEVKYYEPTGKEVSCIRTNMIRNQRIIDDYTIMFVMRGNKAYVNQMDMKCPGLSFHEAIKYKTFNGRLCNTDVIEVLDLPMRGYGPTCGLEKFVELKKLSRDDIEAMKEKTGRE